MSARIHMENIGPIETLDFELRYGLNILTGPNGRGKTITLKGMTALASGDGGKLPLRDGAKKGKIEGLGATITVGAKCRHLGECELENLEGKLSIAQLVDPGLKTPEAADRARIKALATMLEVPATIATFKNHEAFKDVNFDTVVGTKASGCSDIVEMAAQIAKDFQKAARDKEDLAKKFEGEAAGLESQSAGVDLEGECDDDVLQAAYREALRVETQLVTQAQADNKAEERRNQNREKMEQTKREYTGPTVVEAETKRDTASTAWHEASNHRRDIETALANAKEREAEAERAYHETERVVVEAKRVAELIATCEEIVSGAAAKPVTVAQLTAAQDKVKATKEAVLLGQTIRQAKEAAEKAKKVREDAVLQTELAESLRNAGKAVDQVLSDSIKNKYVWVESVDDVARLVVKHAVRGTIPFEDLSAGERWRVAIDLAADQVGKGGLIVIDQEGWEGLDAYVRPELHQHALEREIYVVTAEATRDAVLHVATVPLQMVHFSAAA